MTGMWRMVTDNLVVLRNEQESQELKRREHGRYEENNVNIKIYGIMRGCYDSVCVGGHALLSLLLIRKKIVYNEQRIKRAEISSASITIVMGQTEGVNGKEEWLCWI